MNGFRAIADGSHVVAILALLCKLYFTKSSAAGVSWKSLFLYTATYAARYADLFHFISYYNSSMKIFFIITTLVPIVTIPWLLKTNYQKKFDTFWIELLIIPVTALSLILKHDNSVLEISWTWSIYMEAVAMIPQFYMTYRGGHIDSLLLTYVTGMFCYRGFYIGNWVYRYYVESYYDLIAIGGGITETLIGFGGLIMIVVLYRLRIQPSAGTYFAVAPPSPNGIYTLPFVTSTIEKMGVKAKGMDRDLAAEADTQSLIKLLEEDQQSLGPYSNQLSVPINNDGSFIA